MNKFCGILEIILERDEEPQLEEASRNLNEGLLVENAAQSKQLAGG